MDPGRDLHPWWRRRSGSRRDELRGGRRAEKPGQGPGPTGRSCGDAQVGVKQLLGRKAFEKRAAARGLVWRGLGTVGDPRGRYSLLEQP